MPDTCRSLYILKIIVIIKKCVNFVGLHCNRRQNHGGMPITIGVKEMLVSNYRTHKHGSVTITHDVQDDELFI
jgi:hypothetical protein